MATLGSIIEPRLLIAGSGYSHVVQKPVDHRGKPRVGLRETSLCNAINPRTFRRAEFIPTRCVSEGLLLEIAATLIPL